MLCKDEVHGFFCTLSLSWLQTIFEAHILLFGCVGTYFLLLHSLLLLSFLRKITLVQATWRFRSSAQEQNSRRWTARPKKHAIAYFELCQPHGIFLQPRLRFTGICRRPDNCVNTIPVPLQSALEESREDRLCIETENSWKFEKQKDSDICFDTQKETE